MTERRDKGKKQLSRSSQDAQDASRRSLAAHNDVVDIPVVLQVSLVVKNDTDHLGPSHRYRRDMHVLVEECTYTFPNFLTILLISYKPNTRDKIEIHTKIVVEIDRYRGGPLGLELGRSHHVVAANQHLVQGADGGKSPARLGES